MFANILINIQYYVNIIGLYNLIFIVLCFFSIIIISHIASKLHKWVLKNIEKSCASFILYFIFQRWQLFALWLFLSSICAMQLGIFGVIFGELIDTISDCAKTGKTMSDSTIFLSYAMPLYQYFIIIFALSTCFLWLICLFTGMLRAYLLSWITKESRIFFVKNIVCNNYAYFEKIPKGEIVGAITMIINSSNNIVDKFFKEILPSFIYAFGGLYMFSQISAPFNVLFVGWLLVHFFCVFIRLQGYVDVSRINASLYLQLISKIENVINNILLVKTNNAENFESQYIQEFNKMDIESWRKVMTYDVLSTFITDGVYYIFFSGIVIYFLIQQWSIGAITIARLTQLQSVSRNIGYQLWLATDTFSTIIFDVERVNKALSAISIKNKSTNKIGASNATRSDNQTKIHNNTKLASDPAIELRDVCFAYPGNKHSLLLNQFNLKIPRNSKIGIIGRSGSGKSTIVSLIMKFFTPTKGDIFINGINIANLAPDEINESISYVSNKELVLSRSILENIGYGCKIIREEIIEIINQKGFVLFDDLSKASQERIVFYAKKARAHQFIARSLKGYDTILSVDCNLSSGEKQRLALARALIKESPILILDEATSALDGDNEDEIAKTLESINDKTIIVIAHGFNLIRNYNLIIVMNSGALIEAGTHKALLEKRGAYYDLYNIKNKL